MFMVPDLSGAHALKSSSDLQHRNSNGQPLLSKVPEFGGWGFYLQVRTAAPRNVTVWAPAVGYNRARGEEARANASFLNTVVRHANRPPLGSARVPAHAEFGSACCS